MDSGGMDVGILKGISLAEQRKVLILNLDQTESEIANLKSRKRVLEDQLKKIEDRIS